jgi:hypothetical protein
MARRGGAPTHERWTALMSVSANDALRRLLRAGPPPGDDRVPLFRAMLASELFVPCRRMSEGMQPVVFFGPGRDAPGRQSHLCVFTDRDELGNFERSPEVKESRWERRPGDSSFLDFPVVTMGIKPLCRHATHHGIDAVIIDRSGHGYKLSYVEMIDVLSGAAPTRNGSVQIEAVSVSYFIPAETPPPGMFDDIRALAVSHRLRTLQWCYAKRGEAPPELCLAIAPYGATAFPAAVLELMLRRFAGRFTMTTCDADKDPPSIPPAALRPLIP